MDRRNFLRATALGGSAAAATSLAAPALSQGRDKLTMVTSWPRGLAGVWDAVERFAGNVNDMTGGTLEVEAKGSGELVGALEVFDAVSAGQADIYHAADYYFLGQHPALAYPLGHYPGDDRRHDQRTRAPGRQGPPVLVVDAQVHADALERDGQERRGGGEHGEREPAGRSHPPSAAG